MQDSRKEEQKKEPQNAPYEPAVTLRHTGTESLAEKLCRYMSSLK